MSGMCLKTGKLISDIEAIDRAVESILLTPFGSEPLNRGFGSKVLDFLDKPMNDTWKMELASEVTSRITKQEKRFKVKSVAVLIREDAAEITINGDYKINNDLKKGSITVVAK